MSSEMTSMERVMAVARMEEPDRVPVWLQGIHSALIGATMKEVTLDPEKLAKVNIKLWEYCETDVIKFCPDAFYDGAGWGTKISLPEDDVTPPGATEYGVKTAEDWEKIEVLDPKKDGRLPVQLKATEIAVKETGGKVPVCPVIYSTLTCATHARNLEDVMMDLITEPDLLKKGLEVITVSHIENAKALAEAGAHMVYYNVNRATAEVMQWDQYMEFGVPYDKRVVEEIDRLGMKVFLHSCGAEPFIYDLAEHVQPSHFMNWWDRGPRSHPLKEAKEKLDKKIAMCAGLDQNNTILEGPDAIEAEAKDAIETVAPLPFILGVGCFMPTKPNYDDLKAASRATKKYGKYPLKG